MHFSNSFALPLSNGGRFPYSSSKKKEAKKTEQLREMQSLKRRARSAKAWREALARGPDYVEPMEPKLKVPTVINDAYEKVE